MDKLTPPKGKVIIRKDEPKSVTDSGIYLRPNGRAKSFTGTRYDTGEKVIFIPRVSSTINFDGENLVIMGEDDILASYED